MLLLAIVGVGWAGTRQIEAIRELESSRAQHSSPQGARTDAPAAPALLVDCLGDGDEAFLRVKADELGIPKTHLSLEAARAAGFIRLPGGGAAQEASRSPAQECLAGKPMPRSGQPGAGQCRWPA